MPLTQRRQPKIKLSQDPEGTLYVDGFAGGLNTLVSPQHIQDNECSILLNAVISEDGVISRRPGSTLYDNGSDGSRVFGLGSFTTFDSNGNPVRTLLKMDNSGNLKKFNTSTKAWNTITGHTYTASTPAEFVQGINPNGTSCYIFNGTDTFSRTDGSTITTFTEVADPSGGLTVAQQGTAGTSSWAYTYTLTTDYGETMPATKVSITNGAATLTTSNYNLLTITRSSNSLVTGYNIYRYNGNTGQAFFLKTVPQTASGNPTYSDTGVDTPDTGMGSPLQNTTAGLPLSMGVSYNNQLVAAGNPAGPSVLYFSSTGNYDDFESVDGGGFVLINPEDGQKITALLSYKNQVVVFKERSSYIFNFTVSGSTAIPTVTLVNPQIGCISRRSAKVVLNDVYFFSSAGGVFTLGYQQGYYGAGGVADLLRTNEVSIKVHPTIGAVNPTYQSQVSAIYSPSNYKYIIAYPSGGSTYNNAVMIYDTRYSAWCQWDNLNINCMTTWIDSNNNELVLYGDDNAGNVVELFNGTSDQGNSFTFRMRTKDFNAGAFHLIKTWIWPTFHFRNILGTVTTTVITDGASNVSTVNIASTTSYTGWSYDKWTTTRWGTTQGSSSSATASDAPRQKNIRIDARSIMFLFENTSASNSFSLLGVESRYITRVGRRLPATYIIS